MALVLGSGFMRRTTELSPYVNYYYQLKAAVPITRSAAINVRQISVGSGPKIHGFHGLAKRTEIAVGEEATAPVGFNAGCSRKFRTVKRMILQLQRLRPLAITLGRLMLWSQLLVFTLDITSH
uniref:Uncharacterized protein n=1 Tax=Populus alba TaxID=43335 RepID=A0A4U5NSN8_POPAL|nr:hypothetical protein D5086_0000240170 [Populus alba]